MSDATYSLPMSFNTILLSWDDLLVVGHAQASALIIHIYTEVPLALVRPRNVAASLRTALEPHASCPNEHRSAHELAFRCAFSSPSDVLPCVGIQEPKCSGGVP